LSGYSTQDVSVSFSYSGSAAWGAGGDYVTTPSNITIPAGNLSAMLLLEVNNDEIDEMDESGIITFTSPVNGLIGANSSHTLTIVDDDLPPSVSFYAPSQIVSEEIGVFTTSLTLSEMSGKTIVVPYSISGTTIPEDYVIHNSSPLVFPAGSTTVDINMDILEGDGWEVDETLILTLGTPQNASLGSPASQTIVITEESAEPSVSFTTGSYSVVEGDLVLDINVQLSNAWSSVVFVDYSLSGSAQMGSGADYSIASSPLNIPVGWTQRTIQVVIQDDEIDEAMEDILVTMGTIINATPGAVTTHQIQIVDNDSAPEVFYTSTNKVVLENSGLVTVDLGLSAPSVYNISIPLNISGSASNGDDYSISTTNLTIPAGAITGSYQILLADDVHYDPNETVVVSLGYPTNADLGSPSSFTLTIQDNDLSPCAVGSHLLTVGTDSFSLSIVNQGDTLVFTGGAITRAEALPNQPYLTRAIFAGTTVFSGGDKPPNYAYSAWENFNSLSTETVTYEFDGALGAGTNTIVSNFQNIVDGSTCSLTEVFMTH